MGSNFINYALDNISGLKIINLDLLTYAANKNNCRPKPLRYRLVKGDIGDEKLVKKLMRGADYVVNFAAETHVDRSIYVGASDFIRTNVFGVYNLLNCLREFPRIKMMINVSTDEVWGDMPLEARYKFNEESALRPNSPYSASKAAGLLLARAYFKTYEIPVVTTCSVNNYGIHQFPEKLIPFFVMKALKNKPVPLYGDGRNIRDWLFVDDHTTALLTLLCRGRAGEIYAISRGEEISNRKMASRILRALNKPASLVSFVPDRLGHDQKYSVDSAKIRRLGWQPCHTLDKKLPEVIRWYADNLKIMDRDEKFINPHLKS